MQEPDGEWSEKITFADDGVSFKVRISTNVVSYDLFLKIACEHYGVKYDSFTHLTTFLQEGDPEEALYYDIRGGFHKNLRDYQRDEEKAQVAKQYPVSDLMGYYYGKPCRIEEFKKLGFFQNS